ncbi:MAG TPA: TetR/AcrR family transcriptional regulator [Streptosporangiaceae bacterium]
MTSIRAARQRRRGRVLEAAIFDAVLAELAEVGYGRLTMEGVAVRAGTAKSTLYRRWSSREELVIASLGHVMPDAGGLPDTGDLRSELIAALGALADVLAGPAGRAITAIIGELDRAPQLRAAAHEKLIDGRILGTRSIFERAAARGEIRAGAITPYAIKAGHAVVMTSRIIDGVSPSRRDIEDIVDQVVLPIMGPPAAHG